jgi:N-sulfoglucosamine sulfohydrolase
VLQELEDSGRAEDTLVLFVSDNGVPFPGSKTTLFEPGIHLPMFLRVPGTEGGGMGHTGVRGPAGVRNPNLVSYTDILPTLLDWAGIDAPNRLRKGRSLLSIASESRELPDWGQVYCSHTFHEVTNYYPTRVLRTRRYKYHKNVVWKTDFPFASDLYASLTWEAARKAGSGKLGKRALRDYVRRPHEELYDLEADPDEVRNLAGDPALRDTLVAMRRQVERWQQETDDPWLYKDGVSVRAVRRYVEQGLALPDHHDMEL